jgi:hypothetical protein
MRGILFLLNLMEKAGLRGKGKNGEGKKQTGLKKRRNQQVRE